MAITTAELELQEAEFLPAREVMSKCGRCRNSHEGGSVFVSNNGNTYQEGLINISALNGNFSGNQL